MVSYKKNLEQNEQNKKPKLPKYCNISWMILFDPFCKKSVRTCTDRINLVPSKTYEKKGRDESKLKFPDTVPSNIVHPASYMLCRFNGMYVCTYIQIYACVYMYI